MKTKVTFLVLLSFGAALLTGCVGILPIPPRSTKVEAGRKIERREVRFIVPGSTTRVEVEQRLGPCSRDCPRVPSIAYTWETPAWTVWWWVTPAFIAVDGGNFPVGGWHALFVALDDQGVVLQKNFVSLSRRSSLSEQLERWAKHIRKKNITMKKNLIPIIGAVAVLLAGCVVTSVYPYYQAKDLVFEASLLGDWVSADNKDKPGEFFRVEKLGEKTYCATAFTADQTNSFILHLFRLNRQLFLDTCPTNHSLDHVPVHQISKVMRLQPEIETADLEYKWLAELLGKNPEAIRHVTVRDKEGENKDERIVLTADTAELQKFILKHLNNTNAWKKPDKAMRRN